MLEVSDESDSTEPEEKTPLKSSTILYQFLSSRIQDLSERVKQFLEFVSNCILYLLGFNPQMFGNSGSGDANRVSYNALQSCSEKSKENVDFSVVHSSIEDFSEDSNIEVDSSDSETRCCFAIGQLKRLIRLRQSKRKYIVKKRKELDIKSEDNENYFDQAQINVDKQKENTSDRKYGQKDRGGSENEQPIVREEETLASAEETEASPLKKTATETNQVDVRITRSPRSLFTKTTSPRSHATGNFVLNLPGMEISPRSDKTPAMLLTHKIQGSDCSPTRICSSDVTDTTSRPSQSENDDKAEEIGQNSNYRDNSQVDTDDSERSASIDSESSASEGYRNKELNGDKESETKDIELLLFNKTVSKVSCKPLENYEEDAVRDFLNRYIGRRITENGYDEHVTRIYCTTAQALRQKTRTRDKIFDDAIHACRRSIYNYIEEVKSKEALIFERGCFMEILYLKVMTHFYREFKQCAYDRNHDISPFIERAKDLAERLFLINTDMDIATSVRPRKQADGEDYLMSIKYLFLEDTEQNKEVNRKKISESSSDGMMKETNSECPKSKPVNNSQVKQEITDFLRRFGNKGAEGNKSFQETMNFLACHFSQFQECEDVTDSKPQSDMMFSEVNKERIPANITRGYTEIKQEVTENLTKSDDETSDAIKSFQESIDCLADHFAQLVVKDNHSEIAKDTGNGLQAGNAPERGKGKTLFKVHVFQVKSQKESSKLDRKFNQPNPWKTPSVTDKTSNVPTENTTENIKASGSTETVEKEGLTEVKENVDAKTETPREAMLDNLCAKPENLKANLPSFLNSETPANSGPKYDKVFGYSEIVRDIMATEYPDVATENSDVMDIENYYADTEDETVENIFKKLKLKTSKNVTDDLGESLNEADETNKEDKMIQENNDRSEVKNSVSEKSMDTKSRKKQPPPVPKKPTIRKSSSIEAKSGTHPRLLHQPPQQKVPEPTGRRHRKQPPPVPKKPDRKARLAAAQNRHFNESSNENNSFMPSQRDFSLSSGDENGMSRSLVKRTFSDVSSYSDDEREHVSGCGGYEIVIREDRAYEVIRNQSGTETLIPNVPDFKFGHSEDDSDTDIHIIKENVQDDSNEEHPETKSRSKLASGDADEKYEEHFEIDTSVYDQSGCKILPGSCKKVNPRELEQKDRKKTKTKGVANKHLLKAFNDADLSQEHNDEDYDDELQSLDELDGLANEKVDDDEIDQENDNKNNHKTNIISEIEPVNIAYVQDVRHWQMLPTEVRRKHDEEDTFDDKYSMPTKGTPEDKKKGKKKKERRQKAQPLSLMELNFQFH